MQNLKYWMWFSYIFGPGNNRLWEIIKQFSNVKEAYDNIVNKELISITKKEKTNIKKTSFDKIEKMISYCNNNGINIICYDDILYPKCLKEIYCPAAVLFYYGDLSFIDDKMAIGVVGTRNPSEYSIKITEKICTELVKLDTVIVSGFAYGIDSVAHKSALLNNGITIAVLACGVDYAYPKDNDKIKDVIAKKGAVISEYFPGTKPFPNNFKIRNRLISAFSSGVLVVEAASKSGSLNTANHAIVQGKEVFCVPPHNIFEDKYAGVIPLIRDGAVVTFSHLDIVNEYLTTYFSKVNIDDECKDYFTKLDNNNLVESNTNKSKIFEKPKIESKKEEKEINLSDYTELQAMIINILNNKTLLVDEMAELLQVNVSDVLVELTELEMDNIVKSLAGNRFCLNK